MLNRAFLDGGTWGAPGARVEHVETHAAHVFLVGERAYKIKKAVKYPYLDFSSVEKREAVLARELETNRIFAPDIYLHVAHVLDEPVLVMRRFRGDDLLAERLITPAQLEAVLEEQMRLKLAGQQVALGNLLVHKKCIDRTKLNQILEQQRVEFYSQMSD